MTKQFSSVIFSLVFSLTALEVSSGVIVEYGGSTYSVDAIYGAYGDLQPILQDQIIFGDVNLLIPLADLVGGSLGYPNIIDGIGTSEENTPLSPFFVLSDNYGPYNSWNGLYNAEGGGSAFVGGGENGNSTPYYFATVTQVPIPAAAWLFGSAVLGLGVLKKRRET